MTVNPSGVYASKTDLLGSGLRPSFSCKHALIRREKAVEAILQASELSPLLSQKAFVDSSALCFPPEEPILVDSCLSCATKEGYSQLKIDCVTHQREKTKRKRRNEHIETLPYEPVQGQVKIGCVKDWTMTFRDKMPSAELACNAMPKERDDVNFGLS